MVSINMGLVKDAIKTGLKNGGQVISFVILVIVLKYMDVLPTKWEDIISSWINIAIVLTVGIAMIFSLTTFVAIEIMEGIQYIKLKSKQTQYKVDNYAGEPVELNTKIETSTLNVIKTALGAFRDNDSLTEEERSKLTNIQAILNNLDSDEEDTNPEI